MQQTRRPGSLDAHGSCEPDETWWCGSKIVRSRITLELHEICKRGRTLEAKDVPLLAILRVRDVRRHRRFQERP